MLHSNRLFALPVFVSLTAAGGACGGLSRTPGGGATAADAAVDAGASAPRDMSGARDAGRDSGSKDAAVDMGKRDAAVDMTKNDLGPDFGPAIDAGTVSGCVPLINEFKTEGATANDEWIELYNPCPSGVDVNGWKLVYRSATGSTDITLATLTATIAPSAYLVFANAGYTGTKDGSFTSGLSKTGGGIALTNAAGAKADSVGWGNAANAFVEGSPASAPTTTSSAARLPNGSDANANDSDFALATTPTPGAAN